jgi:hypothetical protein
MRSKLQRPWLTGIHMLLEPMVLSLRLSILWIAASKPTVEPPIVLVGPSSSVLIPIPEYDLDLRLPRSENECRGCGFEL